MRTIALALTLLTLAGCVGRSSPAPAPLSSRALATPDAAVARFVNAYHDGDTITLRRVLAVDSADDLLAAERLAAESTLSRLARDRFGPATHAALVRKGVLRDPAAAEPVGAVEAGDAVGGYQVAVESVPFSPDGWRDIQTLYRVATDAAAGEYADGAQLVAAFD